MSSPSNFITVIPYQRINLQGNERFFNEITSKQIYQKLIERKIKPPAGLVHWYEEFDIDESDIAVGFTFSFKCTKSTFDRTFQYKIMTHILPTNQYLTRYRIRDSNICSKCDQLPDTVSHCLWSCQLLVPYINNFVEYLKLNCKIQENVGVVPYIFGFENNPALNHIFLELKKELFYNFDQNVSPVAFCEQVLNNIRKIMVKEKQCIKSDKMFDLYLEKWEKFTLIYDFRGPDLNIV